MASGVQLFPHHLELRLLVHCCAITPIHSLVSYCLDFSHSTLNRCNRVQQQDDAVKLVCLCSYVLARYVKQVVDGFVRNQQRPLPAGYGRID